MSPDALFTRAGIRSNRGELLCQIVLCRLHAGNQLIQGGELLAIARLNCRQADLECIGIIRQAFDVAVDTGGVASNQAVSADEVISQFAQTIGITLREIDSAAIT